MRCLVFFFFLGFGLAHGQMPIMYPNYSFQPYIPFPMGPSKIKLVFKQAKLTVQLKNDSIETLVAEFDAKSKPNVVTVRNLNGNPIRAIKPGDTKFVSRKLPGGGSMKGIPADSCWLFKVISGKVNAYSNVPVWTQEMIVAFQFEDGIISVINSQNLLEAMPRTDKNLLRFIRKGKWADAINYYNKYLK